MTDTLATPLSRRLLLGLLAAAGLPTTAGLTSCATDLDVARATIERDPAEAAVRPMVTTSLSDFTGTVLAGLDRSTNLICSPLSVSIALAMVRNGAAGTTATEMDQALQYPPLADLNAGLNTLDQLLAARTGTIEQGARKGDVRLDLVNQLFGESTFTWEEELLDALARCYGTGIAKADFAEQWDAERRTINAWVADQTQDTITGLLAPGIITTDTRLVLVNAIYLKAPWLEEFPPAQDGDFRTDGTTVAAKMMSRTFATHGGRGKGWSAAQIPYLGGELTMTVILPDEGAEDELVASFGGGELQRILTELPEGVEVTLTMPTWTYRSSFELGPLLSELGMPTAFTERAEFPGLTGDDNLQIDTVVHEGWIAVDEQGTEASAATAVVMVPGSAPAVDDRLELTLDRPFWFVIHDLPTATPLLAGRVADPTSRPE